nr:putative e3 ubiquitin-protein ligase ari4 [Quercus suber]
MDLKSSSFPESASHLARRNGQRQRLRVLKEYRVIQHRHHKNLYGAQHAWVEMNLAGDTLNYQPKESGPWRSLNDSLIRMQPLICMVVNVKSLFDFRLTGIPDEKGLVAAESPGLESSWPLQHYSTYAPIRSIAGPDTVVKTCGTKNRLTGHLDNPHYSSLASGESPMALFLPTAPANGCAAFSQSMAKESGQYRKMGMPLLPRSDNRMLSSPGYEQQPNSTTIKMAKWEDTHEHMDPLTLDAIVQIQLEDSQAVAKLAKGKQREGEMTDAQIALEMYAEDLNACRNTLDDRKMARSMAIAVNRDGQIIREAYQQEAQHAKDHQVDADISQNNPGTLVTTTANDTDMDADDPWLEDEMLAKASAIYNGTQDLADSLSVPGHDRDFANDPQIESSTQGASRRANIKPKTGHCVICGEEKDFYDVARVPCNHEYCRGCLAELFRLSMTDETLFPPRCDDQEIPLNRVKFFLPTDLAHDFEAKYVELSTKNRIYCHDPHCSTFIPPAESDMAVDWVTCPQCNKTTCTTCKAISHTGDCPDDTTMQQLLETAEAEQWQRCYQCHRFVELQTGCNHMTCPCGAQFCYICGVPWKQCGCPQWDEQNLIARATAIANRAPNPHRRLFQPERTARQQPLEEEWVLAQPEQTAAEVAAQRQRRILDLMADLQENHVCTHDRWRWIGGEHQCEECLNYLPQYIFECRQCHLQACNRCRRNRLT